MAHILRINELRDDFPYNAPSPNPIGKPSKWDRKKKRKERLTDGCLVCFGTDNAPYAGFGFYTDLNRHSKWLDENLPLFSRTSQDKIERSESKCGFVCVMEVGGGYECEFVPIEDYDDELYYKNDFDCVPIIYKKNISIEKTPLSKLTYWKLNKLLVKKGNANQLSSMWGYEDGQTPRVNFVVTED